MTEGRYKAEIRVSGRHMETIGDDDPQELEAAVIFAVDFYRTKYKTADVRVRYVY